MSIRQCRQSTDIFDILLALNVEYNKWNRMLAVAREKINKKAMRNLVNFRQHSRSLAIQQKSLKILRIFVLFGALWLQRIFHFFFTHFSSFSGHLFSFCLQQMNSVERMKNCFHFNFSFSTAAPESNGIFSFSFSHFSVIFFSFSLSFTKEKFLFFLSFRGGEKKIF